MAYSGIAKSSSFFNVFTYTGNGSSQAHTGLGFQPDLCVFKNRDEVNNWRWANSVRGTQKETYSDGNYAEATQAQGLTAFGTDGFTTGSNAGYNKNSIGYVSYHWKSGTTSGITTNGSTTITPTAYTFNQTSGCSIINYTGNGSAGAKVPHGLGVAPRLVIVKVLNTSNNWAVYLDDVDFGWFGSVNNALYLDSTSGATSDAWNYNTAPDATNFTLSGGNYGNVNGNNHLAYCFAQKPGFSRIGSYVGTGNSDGPFIYTGFRPAFVLTKRGDSTDWWGLSDNKTQSAGAGNDDSRKNWTPNTEDTGGTLAIDYFANGFKIKHSNGGQNDTGGAYAFVAFAANPFVADVGEGVPCLGN